MNRIKQKFEELYDALMEVCPIDEIKEDPFEACNTYYLEITETLSTLITRANSEKESLEKENIELKEKIDLYSEQLSIEQKDIPKIQNKCLEKEVLLNELKSILVERERMKAEVKLVLDEIFALEIELEGKPRLEVDKEVSIVNLKKLKKVRKELQERLKVLETQRQHFYDEIEAYSLKIDKKLEFSFEERIGDLKKMLEDVKEEYNKRIEEYERLFSDIKRKEAILNIEGKEFETRLSEKALEEMREYDGCLINEQSRRFDEIFDNSMEKLVELSSAIGRPVHSYKRTEEDLIAVREELAKLYPMREIYIEIVEKIIKRNALLEKMLEFEKVASDPKRLFKSSFQLNSEEKFRNSAYPSLLKLEESLFELIDRFERSYGIFLLEGAELKVVLKNDIDSRIINRTVFISRCDSPFRKKK
ncbi:hypothetical protein GINT2_000546 [Glugoides intestinalis]